jgi:AhpD family alkylhydroperoxidase
MRYLFARATRRIVLAHLRHLNPVPPGRAPADLARVYRQVEGEFGMLAPPVALHAAAPALAAASWSMLRETLLAGGAADRAVKESVAAAVSRANACPYCVDVHGAVVRGLTGSASPSSVEIERWAQSSASPDSVVPAPFPVRQGPELIGVAVAFHYFNRMVNVFLRESPLPVGPPRTAAEGPAAWLMGRLARHPVQPGLSAPLLPAAPPAADLAWTGDQPHIAAAFTAAAAAIEAAGARSLPPDVREVVTSLVRQWPPIDHRAADRAVAGLAAADRPAAKLAILVALSSYRVTDELVAEVRAGGRGDRELIELCGWASFTAAREIGTALAGQRP